MSLSRTRRQLRAHLPALLGVAPRLRVVLVAGDPDDFPNERDFAMCMLAAKNRARIVFAPKVETEPDDVIAALLRHELAHAVLLNLGAEHHAERDADSLAEAIWGDPIRYDQRDVETLGPGSRPRPGYLPR